MSFHCRKASIPRGRMGDSARYPQQQRVRRFFSTHWPCLQARRGNWERAPESSQSAQSNADIESHCVGYRRFEIAHRYRESTLNESRSKGVLSMALFVRAMTADEEAMLQQWARGGNESMSHRAKVILLSKKGYRVPEIAQIRKSGAVNLRKWIRRFNEKGTDGLISKMSNGAPRRFTDQQLKQIVEVAQQQPRDLGLKFTRWTHHKLAVYVSKVGIVKSISHEHVRNVLKSHCAGYLSQWRVSPGVEVV